MKPTIEDLKDSFKVGYEVYEPSRKEADEAWNLYHNRHFTPAQLSVLASRGQPAETFNVIKMFARMLVGYYSTVVNTAVVKPRWPRDATTASVLNDLINYVFDQNRFSDVEGDKVKLSAMMSGLLVSFIDVVPTKEKDPFGRTINEVVVEHVPDYEIILDPMSSADDYSDARWLHRWRWLPEESVNRLFGKDTSKKLDEYYNFTEAREADFEYAYNERFVGKFKVMNNYLIVHTVLEDEDGKRWSCYWCDDHMLEKKEITFKEVRWPYRVEKVHTSDKAEYYGIFKEVLQSQHAINQAVLKIQLLINSQKAYVQEDAVENMAQFETAFNRVTGVIPVLQLSGIKIDNATTDVQAQYIVIDKALERIQKVLGINDSFLGMAYASDSGRKVKLQQNATIMSLRYITARIESFYQLLAKDIGKLCQQYYKAYQVIHITDEITGDRWIELNKPMEEWTGQINNLTGEPVMQPILLPEIDPANGDFIQDEDGNIVLGPVPDERTDFSFTSYEVDIKASAYNDDDERSQLLVETVMSGAIGSMMMQVNPAAFFKMSSLAIRNMKSRYSPEIAQLLDETGQMLGANQGMNQQIAQANQGSQQGFTNGQSPAQSETMTLPKGEY